MMKAIFGRSGSGRTSSMVDIPKPLPLPDPGSEGFWTAAARHVLAIQRCESCGRLAHPPVVVCPACRSPRAEFSFVPVSGQGRLATWTIMRDAFLPGFRNEIPWAIGEAELDDAPGLRLIARLVDGADAPFAIGAPVTVVFEDVSDTVSLPLLKLVAS
jgi:uncharacterized OB-fold protein